MTVSQATKIDVPRSRFLELAELSALRQMRFVTRRQIEGSFSGRHRSRQRGGAAEFVDYREYAAGEDLRRLDWKVLGRTGRPYVRLYQDESDLLCTLAIDASASMLFGSHRGISKLQYAQYLATAISYLIARQQDQVALAVLAGGLRQWVPPGGICGHVTSIQTAIEAMPTEPTTDLAGGLRDLFSRVNRRGAIVVISDFLVESLSPVFASLNLFRHRGWEVILLHLVHPDEETLPQGLAFRFEGLENDGSADCSPGDVRQVYQQRFEAHAAAVRGLALAGGCDYRRVSTAVPYLRTLGGFLIERSG
jgi:uncharacterized protein (DUF58 family)